MSTEFNKLPDRTFRKSSGFHYLGFTNAPKVEVPVLYASGLFWVKAGERYRLVYQYKALAIYEENSGQFIKRKTENLVAPCLLDFPETFLIRGIPYPMIGFVEPSDLEFKVGSCLKNLKGSYSSTNLPVLPDNEFYIVEPSQDYFFIALDNLSAITVTNKELLICRSGLDALPPVYFYKTEHAANKAVNHIKQINPLANLSNRLEVKSLSFEQISEDKFFEED